jgi:hypothetical protein
MVHPDTCAAKWCEAGDEKPPQILRFRKGVFMKQTVYTASPESHATSGR